MKKHWWKLLSVLLLLYVLLAGLLVPLSPGIERVAPEKIVRGETSSIHIQGYNTSFTRAGASLKVWLAVWNEKDTFNICASNYKVTSDHSLSADITVPLNLKANFAHIFVSSANDGTFAQENGISFTGAVTDSASAAQSCAATFAESKIAGTTYPYRELLYETIRNLFFHVPMWFAMLIVLSVSLVYSVRHLGSSRIEHDMIASEMANSGILLGLLGLATGSFWAKHTWGAWWVSDPQLNGAAIAMLIYLAYIILRGSIDEEQKRGRIAAVYNIFAFVMLIVFVGIYPKMNKVDSLHPGSGGNPGFNTYDMDSTMRMVFYPAVIGFALLAIWIANIRIRYRKIHRQLLFNI